ncbi:hypothetical protein [Methylobacterium aquaticum]|jgi:hypothetical protein|uniref:Uncharacterized protein n=1 Tax=Methylobacterium aquaticum TaxID=270351 RepID=A0A0J6S1J6_9HYPH|nr:hypothetical protein [Methylobacterium aquaticum]KMO27494.1 hypothetical protein VP06_30490 [Methylobacterium aquaticum]
MDVWALLTQVHSNIEATCDRATRQVSLIEARERNGLSTDHERNVLRGMRVSLGFEYHQETVLLASLSSAMEDTLRPAPARHRCHRGAGRDCPLPIRCCETLAATVRLPMQAGGPRAAIAAG